MALTYADLDRIAEIRDELTKLDDKLKRIGEFTALNRVRIGMRVVKPSYDAEEIWWELCDSDLVDRLVEAMAKEPRERRRKLLDELRSYGVADDH